MFTTIVAYSVFGLTSLVFVALIIDALIPKNELEKALEAYRKGYTEKYNFWKISLVFFVWFVSGWFLFG